MGSKGGGVPLARRARGLDVVVGVEQHGRCALRAGDLAVDGGVSAFVLEQLHGVEAGRRNRSAVNSAERRTSPAS